MNEPDGQAAMRVVAHLHAEAKARGWAAITRIQHETLFPFLDKEWREQLQWARSTQRYLHVSLIALPALEHTVKDGIAQRVAEALKK